MMFGLVPTLAIAGLSVCRPPQLLPLENAIYDAIVRATPAVPPSDRVVIVDVDERSLTTVGQWPWRRDLVAKLVSQLRDEGAAVVALDIIFAERDRYEGGAVDPDGVLAAALAQGRVVLGYGMTFDEAHRGDEITLNPVSAELDPSVNRRLHHRCVNHPIGLVTLGHEDPDERPFFRATGAVCSLPMLASAARASGFLNAAPDSDGILRRIPLLVELDDRVYPSLALAAITGMSGASDVTLRINNVNSAVLLFTSGGVTAEDRAAGARERSSVDPITTTSAIPLDGKGNLLLRFRGEKRTFPYVSAVDVLHGRAGRELFENKVVLVGTTALGTREVVSTPLDTLFTGVEVQATVADNLLQQDFIHRPEYGVILETLVVLALGLATTILVARGGYASGAAGVLSAVATTWAGSVWLLSSGGAFVSPLYPTMSLAAALFASVVAGLTVERRRADRARSQREASKRLMVQTLLSLTEIRDKETGRHSRRTQAYARVLAQELSRHPDYAGYLTPERIDLLATLAPLHDIGKVGVPDHVLNKPGPLTPEEMAEMRKHPVHGRDVILKAERETGIRDDVTLAIAKDIVYTHHERWDGNGYPEGLREGAIPIPGRVMAVVDVYDAVRTRRLYAPAMSQEETVVLIVKGRGTHFDPAVVDAFLRMAPVMASLSESAELEE
jgi:adenylate cyclase